MKITGTVSRIVSAPSHGGAIFKLKLDVSAATVKVKADHSVLQDVPAIGERISLAGTFARDVHGEQFMPTAVHPELPVASSVLDLLLNHPKFLSLGSRRVRRICRTLGDSTLAALDNGDISALAAAGARDLTALHLLVAWSEYKTTVEASRYLLQRGVSPTTTRLAVGLWGEAAISIVEANPYVLTAVAGWAEVDSAALRHFSITPERLERVRGCCEAICNEGMSRGRSAVPLDLFKEKFVQRMGDVSSPSEALHACTSDHIIFIRYSECGTFVQAAGMADIETSIRSRLFSVALKRTNADKQLRHEKQLPITKSDTHFAKELVGSSLVTIHARGLQALTVANRVARVFPKAVHISPTSAIFSEVSQRRLDWYLLRHFVRYASLCPIVTDKTVVIHECSSIDILLGNKLLRNIANASRIIFVGDPETSPSSGPGNVFASLIRARGITHLFAEASDEESIPTEAGLNLSSGFPSNLRALPFDLPNAIFRKVVKESALVDSAIYAYREFLEKDPHDGVVIASSLEISQLINSRLHGDQVDYLVSVGHDAPIFKLRSQEEATIGDVVIFDATDIERGLFRGSRGLVVKVFVPASASARKARAAIARVRFDTAGDIDVHIRDCHHMSLGHAIQAQHATLSRWRTAIVVIDSNRHATYSWCCRALSRASARLVIVAQEETLRAALARRKTNSEYVSKLDLDEI